MGRTDKDQRKDRMLIYPSTMFAFPNLDIESDRYTQEYVI